jgi:NTP pyrophosphatase (non-canonical NTP hydrolase)
MFYIYKTKNKIGCTNNIKNRVIKQQGYNEYKILFKTKSILLASIFELDLQKKYRFKQDRKKYYELINLKNKIMYHVTNQTITFKNSNINNLKEIIKSTLEIQNEIYFIDENVKDWILKNNFKSQYSDERFIYIESFLNFYNANYRTSVYDKIRNWAQERGIYEKGDPKTQYLKLQEECGELSKAILNNDDAEIIDAIGDCVVVLTNLSKLCGFKIEDCINSAYNEIQNRKGKMINGTFVKNSSISNEIEITVE